MAQERTLGIAGEQDRTSSDPSKAELQRRMEEARESISTTVGEIKETVAHQVENVKDALDWREHFKRQPVAWSLGALGVGFMTGYCIAATFKGDKEDYLDSSHAGQSVRDRLYPGSDRLYSESLSPSPASRATGLGGNGEADHPGLLERFKETSAYDRLSKEVGNLGDRLIDELSTTAQVVVLPALLAKVKNWLGIDLSDKQQSQPQRLASQPNRGVQDTNRNTYEPVLERPS